MENPKNIYPQYQKLSGAVTVHWLADRTAFCTKFG